MCLLVVYMCTPLVEKFLVDYVGINVSDSYAAERAKKQYQVLFPVFMGFGCLTLIESLRGVGSVVLPKPFVRRFALLRFLFEPSDIRRTATVKRAGTYKLNAFVDRAYRVHSTAHKKAKSRNADHETMLNFVMNGMEKKDCGGFFWTWFHILNHSLQKQDYVWIQVGLPIGQAGQIMIGLVLGVLWWRGTQALATYLGETRDGIGDDGSAGSTWALYFFPEPWM